MKIHIIKNGEKKEEKTTRPNSKILKDLRQFQIRFCILFFLEANLLLTCHMKTNSAKYSLQVSSFHINPTLFFLERFCIFVISESI